MNFEAPEKGNKLDTEGTNRGAPGELEARCAALRRPGFGPQETYPASLPYPVRRRESARPSSRCTGGVASDAMWLEIRSHDLWLPQEHDGHNFHRCSNSYALDALNS